mgnify:CR=1 FL=1
MKVTQTTLKDCILIEPDIYEDKRGFFMETFHKEKYFNLGITQDFVQDNYSYSSKGVLRGLHFQINSPQGKLVSVTSGEVYDVVVDLRESSISFGYWEGFTLSGNNKKQLWVPPGFAHGFLTTMEKTSFLYKCTNFYNPDDEGCILWNDKDLNISWPIKKPIVSSKDLNGSSFFNFKK